MSNAVLYAGFKLNQAEIEQLYCVNKAKPQKKCHGKCHLNKQLKETNENDSTSSPKSNLEESYKLNLYHHSMAKLTPKLNEPLNPKIQSTNHIIDHSRLFGTSIFQPPDNQLLVG